MDIIKKAALQGFAVSLLAVALAGCPLNKNDDAQLIVTPTPTPTPTPVVMTLTSTAFVEGAKIPTEYACTEKMGMNRSVPLAWNNAPANTSKYAVIMDDETSPCGANENACKHWAVYNIPRTITSLTTGQKVTDLAGVAEGMT